MAYCYICDTEYDTYKCPECGSMIFKDEIRMLVHSKLESGTIYVSDKKIMICYVDEFIPTGKQKASIMFGQIIGGILGSFLGSIMSGETRSEGEMTAKNIIINISDIKSFIFPYTDEKHTEFLCIQTKQNNFVFSVKDKNNETMLINLLSGRG